MKRKVFPSHKCTKRQLYFIEVDNIDEGEEKKYNEVEESIIAELEIKELHISIHALTRVHSFLTMKVVGSMETR